MQRRHPRSLARQRSVVTSGWQAGQVPTTRTRAVLSVGIGSIIAVVGLIFVIRRVADQWGDVREQVSDARAWWLVASLILAVTAMTAIGLRWSRCLEMLGARRDRWSGLRWFATGQLGKYMPGGVWHVVGQGELARRAGVARGIAYTSVLLATIGLYGTAAVILAALSLVSGSGGPSAWFLVGAIVLAVLAFEPRVLAFVFRRTPDVPVPDRRTTLRYAAGNTWAWLLVAAATVAVAKSISAEAAISVVAAAAVGSWLVGFLALPAPGGLGVREATFVVLAESSMGGATAAAVALMARIVFVLADAALPALIWGASGLVRHRGRARTIDHGSGVARSSTRNRAPTNDRNLPADQ
jgi:uncharacterized membrane protein YbhN (UPF0104 family)